MNLHQALTLLADRLSLNAKALIAFAEEDEQGGRNQGYSGWAIDPVEGKLLYALVRALQPATVLEIGTNEGASAAHLLAALAANGQGELISLDTNPAAGGLIPSSLRERWSFRQEDAGSADLPPVEFVFEDGDHSLAGATATLTRVKALAPRIVISHDYAMTTAHGDFYVRQAFDSVFADSFEIALDGAERGLGVWINPDWKPEKPAAEPEAKPKAAPKKAPKKAPPRKPALRKVAAKQ